MTTIYKICETAQWAQAERNGAFRGSAVDLTDGYIHFSTAAQVAETAAKHFAGMSDSSWSQLRPRTSAAHSNGKHRAAARCFPISTAHCRSPRCAGCRRCDSAMTEHVLPPLDA